MMMNNDNPQFYKSFGGQVIQNHQRNASHNTNNNIHMPLVAGQNINQGTNFYASYEQNYNGNNNKS